MDGIVATSGELLGANAVLAGGQFGDKYSVDYSAESPHPAPALHIP